MDPLRSKPVKVPVNVPATAPSMEIALAFLREGILSIADDGVIWKHFDLDRWGYRKALDPPRRADREGWGNGYRLVTLWFAGQTRAVLAHRLIWVHTFGPIPRGQRISRVVDDRAHNVPTDLRLMPYVPFDWKTYNNVTIDRDDRLIFDALGVAGIDRHLAPYQPILGESKPKVREPKVREVRAPELERWPFIPSATDIDPLVIQINAIVPRWLYEEVRQEVCQELAVAVLADGATLSTSLVEQHIRCVHKKYPVASGYEWSLDAIVPGTERLRRVDLLTTDTPHF